MSSTWEATTPIILGGNTVYMIFCTIPVDDLDVGFVLVSEREEDVSTGLL